MEHKLTKAETRQLTALVAQRQQVIEQANKEIAEIEEAINRLAELIALAEGFPEAGKAMFEGDAAGFVLQSVEEEKETD